ncbi:hypothetical protein SNEBB_001955 [Seison nebaliae]|nr:hypothetical protein SNEBB_001955 [Seison nebaliae]
MHSPSLADIHGMLETPPFQEPNEVDLIDEIKEFQKHKDLSKNTKKITNVLQDNGEHENKKRKRKLSKRIRVQPKFEID